MTVSDYIELLRQLPQALQVVHLEWEHYEGDKVEARSEAPRLLRDGTAVLVGYHSEWD